VTDPILLDVTSLMTMPYRSGIQRVEREAIRHWPLSDQLTLVALDPSGLIRRLPDGVRAILAPTALDAARSYDDDRDALSKILVESDWLPEGFSQHILNLELFYEDWRADAYVRMCRRGWRVQWLIYDFIPWLHPEMFPSGMVRSCMPYLRALRYVSEIAFISQQTREQFERRIMRGHGRSGPVLPLGADGMGLEPQSWSPERRDVVMIGSMERRKNMHLVLDAFRILWARGVDVRLILAALEHFKSEASARQLLVLDHPDDAAIRSSLRTARAALMASEVEGFGLTPLEALYNGVPAIASESLPSLQSLPAQGHIALPSVTVITLADAVQAMMNDAYAEQLWTEAAKLSLPKWTDFAHAVAQWAAHTNPG
jgi:glycosyltransferase involved in cell wall biosynthesis